MWESFASYLADVAVQWWWLLTGLVAGAVWLIRFLWLGSDKWAEKHFDRIKKRKVALATAIAALLVATFLAYHDQRSALLAKQRAPQLEQLDQSIKDLPDGMWKTTDVYAVVSPRKVNLLRLFVRSTGLASVTVRTFEKRETVTYDEERQDTDTIILRIQNPAGSYEITTMSQSPGVSIVPRFE